MLAIARIVGAVNRLEALSLAAYRAFLRERAVSLPGGAVAFRVDEAPRSPMVNRIVGLGIDQPATEADLEAALEVLAGTTHYVAVSPAARPPELAAWLEARGLERGWGWMQFQRSLEDIPVPQSALELVEVDASSAPAFARVVRIAYDLPGELEPVLASIVETPWQGWLALVDDEPAAAGALFAEGEGAYLGFAGTLPAHRGRGAQGALLATRLRRARELGCRWVATETGEQRPDRPSSSYRNIVRAGFTEEFVVANWLGR